MPIDYEGWVSDLEDKVAKLEQELEDAQEQRDHYFNILEDLISDVNDAANDILKEEISEEVSDELNNIFKYTAQAYKEL